MPKLAARLALSVAVASVVMTGLEALRLRHPRVLAQPRSPSPPTREEPHDGPRLAPRQQPVWKPTPDRSATPLGVLAMARIHGRVVGERGALEALEIDVEGAGQVYQPRIEDDGRFEINLPPGSYAVVASAGSQVALAEVADLAEHEDRMVVLALAEGASVVPDEEGAGFVDIPAD